MTTLIESQLTTIVIMLCCGIIVGMVYRIFSVFILRFTNGGLMALLAVRICCYVIIAFIIGEFIMFCQNGNLMLYEFVSLGMGLLLWRKIFCDKINTR